MLLRSQRPPSFMEKIVKQYSLPSRVALHVSIIVDENDMTGISLKNARCKNGEKITSFIQSWLDDNAYEGDYHLQGIVDVSAKFDYVMIPREEGSQNERSKVCRKIRGGFIRSRNRMLQ